MPQIDIRLNSSADDSGFRKIGSAGQNLQRSFGQLEQGFVRLDRVFQRFRPENIIKSFLGGFGVGSAFAAIDTAARLVDQHFKQVEQNVRALAEITRKHEASLEKIRRMDLNPMQTLWADRANARDQERTLNALRRIYGASPDKDQIDELGKRQAALDSLRESIRQQEKALESKAAAEAKNAEKEQQAQRAIQGRLALERQRYQLENDIRELEFRGETDLAELKKGELFRLNEVARLGPEIEGAARQRWAMEAAQQAAAQRREREAGDRAKQEHERRVEFMRVEDSLSRDLAANRRQQSEVEADPALTDMERRARIVPLIETEMELLADVVRLKREERGLTDNPVEQRQLEAEIFRLREQLATLEGRKAREENPATKFQKTSNAYGNMGDGSAHYQTVGEGALGGAMNFLTQLGTMADQVAAGIENTLGAAVNGITQGIMGWINGTMTFREALANIGQSVLQTILQTLVQMGVRMVLNALLSRALQAATAAATIAMAAPTAVALSAIWSGPATLATIATMGGAAAQAPISVMAAKMQVFMSSISGFAEGGVVRGPGTGTSDSILARLSNGEGVLTTRTTSFLGEDFINQLNADPISALARPYQAPAALPSSGGDEGSSRRNANLNIAFIDPMRDAGVLEAFKRDPRAETFIVNVMHKNRHRLGVSL